MSVSFSLWNLVSQINMNACHLRKTELEYELLIRGLSTKGTVMDLRKRLSQSYGNNTPMSEECVGQLDPEEELRQCTSKYQDLSALVEECEGDMGSSEYQRISTRLWHLHGRVGRIPIPAASDEEMEKRRSELLAQTMSIIDSLKKEENIAKAPTVESKSTSGDTEGTKTGILVPLEENIETGSKEMVNSQPQFHASPVLKTNPVPPVEQIVGMDQPEGLLKWLDSRAQAPGPTGMGPPHFPAYHPRSVPVYKWGLKFDNGNSQSVGAFLERVEEFRRARGVSPEELFQSAVDLFSGTALVWYRSTVNRIKSWGELCQEMRIVFQTPGYDFRLHQEIFNRFQGEHEPLDLYLAAMEGLYGRLSTSVPEEIKLRQMLDNLHPQLQDRLSLFEFKNIEELRLMGRRAEIGRLRSAANRPTPRNASVLEPDLAYSEPSRRKEMTLGRVAALQAPARNASTSKCWNCGITGHRYAGCKKEKKKFCFGCGQPEIVRSQCPKCRPKNLPAGEPTN